MRVNSVRASCQNAVMSQSEFIFAVDGGATKTAAELRRWDGSVLAQHHAGPCNLYQDAIGGIANIRAAWSACAQVADVEAADTVISAGVAGSSAAEAPAKFYAAFNGFANALLSGDGYTALVGAFGSAPGALLSIGTGVVGCRFDAAGTFTQLGGWGFLAGDRGGGAWMGLQLVTAWLEHRDGMGEGEGTPTLWRAVAERLGTERRDILGWLRTARPDRFAALVPDLLRQADQGCDVAVRLRNEAVGHIARLALAISGDADLPVVLSGGLAAPLEPYLRAVLGERLLPLAPISPLDGAWRIARGERPAEFV